MKQRFPSVEPYNSHMWISPKRLWNSFHTSWRRPFPTPICTLWSFSFSAWQNHCTLIKKCNTYANSSYTIALLSAKKKKKHNRVHWYKKTFMMQWTDNSPKTAHPEMFYLCHTTAICQRLHYPILMNDTLKFTLLFHCHILYFGTSSVTIWMILCVSLLNNTTIF